MSGDADRLDKLENGFDEMKQSVLLMGKDVHSLTESTKEIATSLKVLVDIQQNMKVLEERYETRHTQLKDADTVIHKRLDAIVKKDETVEKQAAKGETAYKILVQIALWLGAGVVLMLLGLFVFVIQLQGGK